MNGSVAFATGREEEKSDSVECPPVSIRRKPSLKRNRSSRFAVETVAGAHVIPEAPENCEEEEMAERLGLNIVNAGCTPPPTQVANRFTVQTNRTPIGAKSVSFQLGPPQNPPVEDADLSGGELQSPGGTITHTTSTYGTQNVKSFRNVETLEKIPNVDHYRNVMSMAGAMATRPTLLDLHAEDTEKPTADLEIGELQLPDVEVKKSAPTSPKPDNSGPKFGWIQGVLIRCFLNIIGVMLYLRLSWVAGQAGIGIGSLIVLLACTVTTLTTLSMCAICTNGEIRGGGAYFMISRSLGPEFGGSIGLIFAFANAVAVAMYVVGFSETVVGIMKDHGLAIVDAGQNDQRIIGLIVTVVLLGVTLIGVAFESKAQMGLMAILVVSIVNYYVGTFIPPSDEKRAKGFTGYSADTFTENFFPAFRGEEGFFSVFAIFFPAATGILAGANISGDLADPQKAIPKGTLLAIFVTTIIYLSGVWMCGATMLRDASGDLFDLTNGTLQACVDARNCSFGLMNHFQVMEMSSGWGPLVTAGIFAATLSSALASLVSAPKVFQGQGKGNEPRRAYLLAFVIAIAMVCIGDLNHIAPIISNFFLAAYALVNYATFDASLAKSPGFRPSFKYYNMWLSLCGACLCVAVMFLISWWSALVTLAFIAVLYVYVHHRKPEVNWGSSSQAHSYRNALVAMHKLQWTEEHIKNFRPQILVLTGNPVARPSLVDFTQNITKDNSLLVCGHVYIVKGQERISKDHLILALNKFRLRIVEWLKKRKTKSFYSPIAQTSLRVGVQNLLQLTGLGKMRPNVVVLGYKNNWKTADPDSVQEYFNIIHDCFDANLGVGILRVAKGLDFSDQMRQLNLEESYNLSGPESTRLTSRSSGNDMASPDEEDIAAGVESAEMEAGMEEPSAPVPVIKYWSESLSSTPQFISAQNTPQFHSAQNTPQHRSSASSNNGLMERIAPMARGEENEHLIEDCTNKLTQSNHSSKDQSGNETDENSNVNCIGSGAQLIVANNNCTAQPAAVSGPVQTPLDTFLLIETPRVMSAAQRELVDNINEFSRRVKKATIDVWWLFDDGGLTLLVPHLLSCQRSYLEGAKLRVFTIASSKNRLEQEQRSMAALLSKFRINFSDVYVIPDITRRPAVASLNEFDALIADLRTDDDVDLATSSRITEAELLAQRDRTYRLIRTRELLMEHSKNAKLVIVTLPMPRKGACSAALYMAWLETLSKDMPPIFLLRGNQQSVLTFYS